MNRGFNRPSGPPGHGGPPLNRGPGISEPTDDKYFQALKGDYLDAKGNVKCEFITSLAEQAAQMLGSAPVKGRPMAYGQLRKFYDQAVAVKSGLEARQDFSTLLPKLCALVPAAFNAVGAGNAPQVLKQFIEANVGIAQRDEKHFKAFMTHFQSVIAYYKYHFPKG